MMKPEYLTARDISLGEAGYSARENRFIGPTIPQRIAPICA
jgi:hypothetical protein